MLEKYAATLERRGVDSCSSQILAEVLGRFPKSMTVRQLANRTGKSERYIKRKVKDMKNTSLGKIRTMLQLKGAAEPDSVRVGTPENPGPGFGRRDKVLESFLNCGGRSAVTGRPVSIGGSNVDHRLSLGLGGKDEPTNWIWMETNLNMMKSALSDEKFKYEPLRTNERVK